MFNLLFSLIHFSAIKSDMEKTHNEHPKTGSTFVTEQDTLFTSTEPVKFEGPEKASDQSEGVKQDNPNVTRVVNPPRKSTSNLRFESSCNCFPSLFFVISGNTGGKP